MAKVGILVPREQMQREAEELLQTIPLDVVCCRTIATADTVNEARTAAENGAQILIARGYQAQILRKYTDTPLVEIRFTGQEVGLLLQRAKEISGKPHPHIAIIAFENMLPDTSHMGSLMDVRLTVTSITDAEVVGGVLEEYEKDRPDVIIGGEVTCAAARELGYLTVFYQSTEESIAEALKTAQRISYAIDSELQHVARFEAVLDTSFNGIVQVNAERSVLSLNHAIEQLIKKKEEEAVGLSVDELFPSIDLSPLTRVLTGERENVTISLEYNNEAFMLLVSPIEYAGRITGAILSFRQISAMSSLTRQARREMILSGYRTNVTFNDMPSKNARMQEVLETAKVFALSDSPVLFYEEEGNEAAMIARAIHNNSDRKSGPFVSIDIRDLAPEEQIEALFYRKESPAASEENTTSELGALLRANKGTLFINRIEKLTLKAQHQLLRILLPYTYMHTDARPLDTLNVRIIACAKRNLLPAVEEEGFSEELYYHLSGMMLAIPPLETRPEDLQEAFRSCVNKYTSKYHRHMQLTAEALRLASKLRWPGGFAQIDAFCERIVLASGKRRIDERVLQDIYKMLYPEIRKVQGEARLVVYDTPEAQQIRELLEKHGGDRAAVAKELGISKTTLWRHMKKYNVAANYSE